MEPRLSGVRAILFDLGDTLFRLEAMDLDTAYRRFALALQDRIGLDPSSASAVAGAIGRDVGNDLARRYAAGGTDEPSIASVARPHLRLFGAAAGELAVALEEFYGEADIDRWALPPGRAGDVRRFVEAGLQVAFVSNTQTPPALMRRRLAEFGLLELATIAIFSVEVGHKKPGEQIYRAALDGLAISPAEALFVGDRVREDVLGPQALGMQAVLTHEFRQETPAGASPAAVIGSLSQLWDLL
jgi:putative hydrolase of the HAD superfamily